MPALKIRKHSILLSAYAYTIYFFIIGILFNMADIINEIIKTIIPMQTTEKPELNDKEFIPAL